MLLNVYMVMETVIELFIVVPKHIMKNLLF